MPKHIYLGLAIHNHQPVGNFDFVFAEAYQKAYEPMIALLEKHPSIRMALHYTGCLRDWIVENRPDFFPRIATLVGRGQVEIMTGGYYEPILVAIPDVDKFGQIEKLTQAVRNDFGYEPTGLWLAERVWEPHLAKPLAEAGIEYTIVDDTHFKYVGLQDEDLFGYYVTEEQGFPLKIFGTSKWLRYSIPWRTVEEVMEYLREEAGESGRKIAVMGDDGEKFGLWPGTYEHCWEKGWMERFFTALEENGDWVETIPPGEYAHRFPALGRIYLPTASYDEMTEWALPAQLAGEIVHLKHRLQGEGQEDVLRFVRGGFWRTFMVKYPEVNNLHKKMLWVSEKVNEIMGNEVMRNEATRNEATGNKVMRNETMRNETLVDSLLLALDHLWAGQCNCPYWHGVFGGIYLFHIRAANYHHLLTAEEIADRASHGDGPWVEWREADFDRDASPELLLESDAMNLYFDPADGGCLFEWDWRARSYNLLNTLSRRPEGYHQDLVEAGRKSEIEVAGQPTGELETIHTTLVRAKEPDLHLKLYYDWYRRVSLIDHLFRPNTTLEEFYRAQYGELGDFVNQPYDYRVEGGEGALTLVLSRDGGVWQGDRFLPFRVEKQVRMVGGSTDMAVLYILTNTSQEAISAGFGVESNWGILGGNGPGAYLALSNPSRLPLDSMGQIEAVGALRLVSEDLAMEIGLGFSRPATLWRFPIEAISNSEAGFERGYQSTCLLPWWVIGLEPGERWQVQLEFALRQIGA